MIPLEIGDGFAEALHILILPASAAVRWQPALLCGQWVHEPAAAPVHVAAARIADVNESACRAVMAVTGMAIADADNAIRREFASGTWVRSFPGVVHHYTA